MSFSKSEISGIIILGISIIASYEIFTRVTQLRHINEFTEDMRSTNHMISNTTANVVRKIFHR